MRIALRFKHITFKIICFVIELCKNRKFAMFRLKKEINKIELIGEVLPPSMLNQRFSH